VETTIPAITVAELRAQLGTAAAPIVIDVRKPEAYDADSRTLAGALRRAHDLAADWAAELPAGRAAVTCCVHGHQVSQGAAQALIGRGFDARFLEGGIEAWKKAGAPTIVRQAALGVPAARHSAWITRERPKIDRIACPWLVLRFIDPLAAFHYVPADRVMDEAKARQAIPYDVKNVQFAHRGERCSFDALIADFDLHDTALDRLAAIVRGADCGRPELTPQSAGLLAISQGLSANFADDHAMLAHGLVVYDALYAWCRTAV
jgi:rhodanese-related sulfurtransferase